MSPRLLVSSEVWRYFTGHFPGQAPATAVLQRFSGNKSIVLVGFEEIRLFTEENTSRHVSRTCLQYFFVTRCVRKSYKSITGGYCITGAFFLRSHYCFLLKTKLRAFLVFVCFKTDEFGAFRVKFGRFFCYLSISTKSFDALNSGNIK